LILVKEEIYLGFRILVVSRSSGFCELLQAAFEALDFSLLLAPEDLLAKSATTIREYIEHQHIRVVVHFGMTQGIALTSLATSCEQSVVPLIHLSSYRVFGETQVGSSEAIMPEPDDFLGNDLFAMEQAVISCGQAIMLRLPWSLMSSSDFPFDEGLLNRTCFGLLNNAALTVSEGASGCLVNWQDVTRTIAAISQQILCGAKNWGVFHLRSSDVCSEAEFADVVARLLKSDGFCVAELAVIKGKSPFLVERSSVLSGRRCTDSFGIQQKSFRVGLKGHVQRWARENGYIPVIN
jgi:dTDP-4-dehydrorhamnose reductase